MPVEQKTPFFVLDLETGDKTGDLSTGYGLEPWRARQGLAFITSCTVTSNDGYRNQILRPTREQLIEQLEKLAGQEVVCHNGVFDVAWLISSIEPQRHKAIPECIKKIRWRDSLLLAKWVTNGRKAEDQRFSYSLQNLIMAWFKDEPGAIEFIEMKQGAPVDSNSKYWDDRAWADCLWTGRLYEFLLKHMPQESWRGFIIEQRAIPQIANSWVMGMRVNLKKLEIAEATFHENVSKGCEELGVPASVLSSPAQLANLLFNQWGYQPVSKTPTGKPSADADSLIILAHTYGDQRLKKILHVRQNLTLISKYIKSMHMSLARTGDGYMYAIPKMFGTSTGRLTMSSETLKGDKYKVSIAQHQIPRKDKLIRDCLEPPEGKKLFETDAAAQESRIMGIWSGDSEIIRIFANGINMHSSMGSEIYGRAYEEFQKAFKGEDPATIEQRQMGKLTNLSCNFRIGGKSLAKKALTEYDTFMTEVEGRKLVNTFKRKYPGVPIYWNSIIDFAKAHGYSYTLAQRRWKVPIEMLNSGDAWKVEGTVISHPIQGSGGEMFYAAMSQVPDALMQTSLHDGIFWAVDEENGQEEADYILHQMNKTPYEQLWNLPNELPIKLLYEESKVGTSYKDVK